MNEILEQNFCRDSFSIWYGAETSTLRKVDQKYLLRFGNCCWRRLEKVNCTYGMKNEVLQMVKKESSFVRTIKRKKTNCIGQI
jgi:hypothetical protein